jgi:hypothetical protein
MTKENKTSSQLAKLVQAETVRRGMGCDVLVRADSNYGWTATALVAPSRAAEFQFALDAIATDLREKYQLKRA